MSYWKPSTADYNLAGRKRPLNHIASNQYDRLSLDDEVFVVTIRKGALKLLGKVVVGRIVDQRVAEAYCGQELWDSSFHVLAKPGTELPLVEVDVSGLVERLRFKSERDRLAVNDGQVDAKQLQTMRELTPQSAAHLDDVIRRRK